MDISNQKSNIWFSSDFHFGHDKEFLYQPRGFWYIWQHDNEIILDWNKIVKPDDEVYILGDLMLQDNVHGRKCINQLNGIKHIIIGNHDTAQRIEMYKTMRDVVEVVYATQISYGKYHFFLSHYPTLMDNLDRGRKNFNLHGHTHSKDKFQFIDHCCYNVALDAHDNKPVSIDTIIQDIQQYRQEHNNEQKTKK